MSNATAVPKVSYEPTTWSEWSYLLNEVPTDQTETPNIDGVDMGTIVQGTIGEVKGLSVNFNADFDDTIFDVYMYLANNPEHPGHSWLMDVGAAATFPATIITALPNAMPCNPIAGAASRFLGAAMYNSSDKRIQEIIIQLEASATAKIYDAAQKIYSLPHLVIGFQRLDQVFSALEVEQMGADIDRGHLAIFSDVNLFHISETGCWTRIATIREDTFDLSSFVETIEWRKGKPTVTYYQARSNTVAEAKFQLAQVTPAFEALALDTKPIINNQDKTIVVNLDGIKKPTREARFAIQYSTEGGFQKTWYVNRGKIIPSASFQPGSAEFAEQEFTITALASGCNRSVIDLICSLVPQQEACWLPLDYIVEA